MWRHCRDVNSDRRFGWTRCHARGSAGEGEKLCRKDLVYASSIKAKTLRVCRLAASSSNGGGLAGKIFC